MEALLPDQLRQLWKAVEEKRMSQEDFAGEQERLTNEYKEAWRQALILPGQPSLQESLLSELGDFMKISDRAEVRRRCEAAVQTLKGEWHSLVKGDKAQAIEQFYDQSQTTIYELMWWHTLIDDLSPLAYVNALHFAKQHGCRSFLDFGAGVGSGGILFGRHQFAVTLSDISSTLLGFTRWRMEQRGLNAAYLDLKVQQFPDNAFDFIAAMDVFEHLVKPEVTVEQLWKAMKPGAFLYARIAAETDEDRPQHIVEDFTPTFERMKTLGFVEVWQDSWLWGHQVFQKPK